MKPPACGSHSGERHSERKREVSNPAIASVRRKKLPAAVLLRISRKKPLEDVNVFVPGA
jgi:hypothetical protein